MESPSPVKLPAPSLPASNHHSSTLVRIESHFSESSLLDSVQVEARSNEVWYVLQLEHEREALIVRYQYPITLENTALFEHTPPGVEAMFNDMMTKGGGVSVNSSRHASLVHRSVASGFSR